MKQKFSTRHCTTSARSQGMQCSLSRRSSQSAAETFCKFKFTLSSFINGFSLPPSKFIVPNQSLCSDKFDSGVFGGQKNTKLGDFQFTWSRFINSFSLLSKPCFLQVVCMQLIFVVGQIRLLQKFNLS